MHVQTSHSISVNYDEKIAVARPQTDLIVITIQTVSYTHSKFPSDCSSSFFNQLWMYKSDINWHR
jgi:hypothetical protein